MPAPSLLSLLVLALVSSQVALARLAQEPAHHRFTKRQATAALPYNVALPGATPSYVPRAKAVILPFAQVIPLAGAASLLPNSPLAVAVKQATTVTTGLLARAAPEKRLAVAQIPILGGMLGGSGSSSTSASSKTAAPAASSAPASTQKTGSTTTSASSSTVSCLGTGQAEQQVNSLFQYGGAGTIVYLCPSAVLSLANPIQYTAANQTLTTLGYPTDSTRATIKVTGTLQTNAITGSCASCNNVALRNVIVDGGCQTMGYYGLVGGTALLEFGGSTTGQIIDNVRAFEPRSWSALHAIEGTKLSCSGMKITNNVIGPAGHAPSGAAQQKRDTGSYPANQWADGISMACKGSLVQGNTVIDATDGAIVVFGAPGSTITSNTIVANDRVAMGGINMVDYGPFSGSFAGTTVTGNTLFANTSMIKIGIANGILTWGSYNSSKLFTSGGTASNNVFTSGPTGFFGFGMAAAGTTGASLSAPRFVNANFGGVRSSSCPSDTPSPVPGPLFYDAQTTSGMTLGATAGPWTQTSIADLICMGPVAPALWSKKSVSSG